MANAYHAVDLIAWPRAQHCEVFRCCVEPYYCLTFPLDVTCFLSMVRREKLSFSLALLYVVAHCANEIEAFRYRFVDGQVVLFNHIDVAFTSFVKETELFKVVNVPLAGTMGYFVHTARQIPAQQKECFTGPLGNDVYQFSPLPWFSYPHISHTNAGHKDNATPLFDWGRYQTHNETITLPFPSRSTIPLSCTSAARRMP